MPENQQLCALATKTAFEAVLRDDAHLWADCRAAGVWFHWDFVPLALAIEKNEKNGIVTYLDRIH